MLSGTLGKSKNTVKMRLGTLVRLEPGLPAFRGKNVVATRHAAKPVDHFLSRGSHISRSTNSSWDAWDGCGTAVGRVKIQKPSVKCGLGRWDGSKGGILP